MACLSLVILLSEAALLLLLPGLLQLDYTAMDKVNFYQAPSSDFWLGTDETGRDMLARFLEGGRVTLFIGLSATAISVIIGLPLGLMAGYFRGFAETVIMRTADMFLSFPLMVIILVVVAVFGASIPMIVLLIGILHWPAITKLIYGNVLTVSSMEYVQAERAIGTGKWKILFGTVLPNAMTPLWVALAFRVSSAMMTESALSFLGAGVQSPEASWGSLIQSASSLAVITQRWWLWIPESLALVITVVCVNFVGEGLRDALDAKMNSH